MKSDLKLDFQLLGTSIAPKKISEILRVEADAAFLKGEKNPRANLPRQNIWMIESHVESDDLADHWAELELKLIGSKDEIREIAKSGIAKLTVVISSKVRIPSIIIPSSMSFFAGYVDAVVDIDHIQF